MTASVNQTEFNPVDVDFMARALRLAEKGLNSTHPNPRVGCVLVKDGQVIGEGWHRKAGEPHAEILALQQAGKQARGATAYVTLEPCCHQGRTGPCSQALIDAGVAKVIAAMPDPNPKVSGQGLQQLEAAGVLVGVGCLQNQAGDLNRGFCRRMTQQRPWVMSKLAMSLDGRTAMASGESKWITGPASRRDVHRLRARHSIVLTGVDTVMADDPQLTPRDGLKLPLLRTPDRVILDSRLRTPLTAQMLNQSGCNIILTCCEDQAQIDRLQQVGFKVFVLPSLNGRLDLNAVMCWLGQQEVNEVMVEAGAILNGALMQAGLVDEWYIYTAPCVLGDAARGVFHLSGLTRIEQQYRFKIESVRRIGDDMRLHLIKQAET